MADALSRKIHSELDANRSVLEATLFAREIGFADVPAQMIATAVSELVRNILKYAGSGELHLRRVHNSAVPGVEIEVVDYGPGIADCEAAMSEHFSSSGTLGMGLPGVRRMMDDFSLESSPGQGTRVTVRKWM